jgi:transcriptional regulator with XRE-family HTH domain
MDANALLEWFDALPIDPAETVKLEFAVAIDRAMRDRRLSRKQVAQLLGTSPAWVTKVLRGDVNLTVDSMVRLCGAVGRELQIRVVETRRAS